MPKVSAQDYVARARTAPSPAAAALDLSNYDTNAHVCAVYLHGATVDAFFMQSVINLMWYDMAHAQRLIAPDHAHFNLVSVRSGPLVAAGRNKAASIWLEHFSWCDWLLMIDADMSFAPDSLDRLMEISDPKTAPIVGGLCNALNQEPNKIPYQKVPTLLRREGRDFTRITSGYRAGDILEVDATGCAFLLVHRSVFEATEQTSRYFPWFYESERDDLDTALGEDVTFCMNARDAGFPIKVHTGVHIMHRKVIFI